MNLREQIEEDFGEIDRKHVEGFAGKSVLITGATGFLGSLLVKYFDYANNYYGTGVAVYACARNEELLNELIQASYCPDSIIPVVADLVSDEIAVDGSVDYIFHLASITTSKTMVERPVDVIDVSLFGTRKILELARQKKARMLYASSMEAYGTFPPDHGPVSEDELGYIDISSVRSCYPESKRMCENMCHAFGRQYGVDYVIARLAAVFGRGSLPSDNRAINQFVRAALAGDNIVLRTQGLSETNYVYSSDAIAAALLLMLRGKSGVAYNVSNMASHMTIRGVAEMVADVVNHGQSHVVISIDNENKSGYVADVKLFLSSNRMTELGWRPKADVRQAFMRLSSYCAHDNTASK